MAEQKKFMPGDRITHYKYGNGTILGNYHKRGGSWYWHVAYDDKTFGYNTESSMTLLEDGRNGN